MPFQVAQPLITSRGQLFVISRRRAVSRGHSLVRVQGYCGLGTAKVVHQAGGVPFHHWGLMHMPVEPAVHPGELCFKGLNTGDISQALALHAWGL